MIETNDADDEAQIDAANLPRIDATATALKESEEREAAFLSVFEGWTYEEIGEWLGVGRSTIGKVVREYKTLTGDEARDLEHWLLETFGDRDFETPGDSDFDPLADDVEDDETGDVTDFERDDRVVHDLLGTGVVDSRNAYMDTVRVRFDDLDDGVTIVENIDRLTHVDGETGDTLEDQIDVGTKIDVSGPEWLPAGTMTVDEVNPEWAEADGCTVFKASLDRRNARSYCFRVFGDSVETTNSAGRWGVRASAELAESAYDREICTDGGIVTDPCEFAEVDAADADHVSDLGERHDCAMCGGETKRVDRATYFKLRGTLQILEPWKCLECELQGNIVRRRSDGEIVRLSHLHTGTGFEHPRQ